MISEFKRVTQGRKTGGRDFTKGDPRCGKPRMSPAASLVKGKNRKEVRDLLAKYLNFDINDLQAIAKDPTRTVIEHWVARIAIEGVKGGDISRMSFMFDQIYGKLTETKRIELPRPTIIERLDGTQLELGSEMVDGDKDE